MAFISRNNESRLASISWNFTKRNFVENPKQQSLITVYLWPTKENELLFLFAANKRKFAVSVFRLRQTNGSCCFPFVLFLCTEFRKHGDMDRETWDMETKTWKHGELDMRQWRQWHMDTGTWTCRHKHGYMDVETWTWICTWTWRHGHGYMDVETWT
jgi:hypothetical protein